MVVGMPSAIAPNIELQTRSPRPDEYDTLFRGSPWRPSLIHIGALAELSLDQLTALEQRLITIPVSRGDVLVREGDDADALYLVASGHFVVESGGRRVAEISSGAPIGEIAFFANGKRTATVRAHRDSIVLKLPRDDFTTLCEENPTILKGIARTLAQRLSDTISGGERTSPSRPRTLVVLNAGQEPLFGEFRERLMRAFSRASKILVIDAKLLADNFPNEVDYELERITGWLNQQETRHDYLLYFADAGLTPFSRKAIRQADQVLLVGRHNAVADPASLRLSAVENFAFEIHPPSARRLVLLHEARASISNTSIWLKSRPVALHHHLVIDNDAHYDRLVRFISGNAIGFVACGGGALCAAHIGVYKALTNAGVSFDLLGGTSGGGAMAAAFAMGSSADDVSKRTCALIHMSRALKRWTWPRYSLLDHTVIDQMLKEQYGKTEIEDLWKGFFAVSTCLANNALTVITKGPVWKAVRASISIPGLLPPVYQEDGSILVDGALLDNVPVKSMRALKSGPNVVVNFRTEDLKSVIVDYNALPSRGQMFWGLLNPFARRRLPNAPSLTTVLLRSLMVGRDQLADKVAQDDLLIIPPLPKDIGVMDWGRHAELSAIAYDYTSKLIDDLHARHPLLATTRALACNRAYV